MFASDFLWGKDGKKQNTPDRVGKEFSRPFPSLLKGNSYLEVDVCPSFPWFHVWLDACTRMNNIQNRCIFLFRINGISGIITIHALQLASLSNIVFSNSYLYFDTGGSRPSF